MICGYDGGNRYMSILEANLALLLTIPEESQEEIQSYLLTNFCGNNPYKPLSSYCTHESNIV